MLAGMVLGAIAVFIIDRKVPDRRGGVPPSAACSSFVGLIHGEEVVWFTSEPRIALGYGLAAVACLGFHLLGVPVRERDPADPNDVPETPVARTGPLVSDAPPVPRPAGATAPA